MYRIGNGYDVHALQEGLPLILGGIRLQDAPKGCVAHSDGDCLIHALCDALLGALALGDIGLHFPDTDPAYKGIDSRLLLARCCALVRSKGWEPVNADCTVCLQRPKLRGHIDAMRRELARVMEVEPETVSVKATTTEHLGFTGREEGVAVYATVLLRRPQAK